MRIASILSAVAVAGALAFGGTALAETPKKPSGTVSIEETQFGLIIGGSFGGGILTFDGKQYPFKLGGLSLGASIGMAKIAAVGEVYDLKKVEDFAGTYVKLDGNVSLGGGVGGMTMKNEHGVIMNLRGTSQGLQFTIGASGVTVTLEDKK